MDGFAHSLTAHASDEASVAGTAMQRTLKAAIDCVGIGLHSGHRVALTLRPAPANHGIVFRRRDLGADIPARFDLVADSRLCTVLAHPTIAEARIGTVEHLMAALHGIGITNALIEVDGPELPILDGSAASFVFLADCAGTMEQEAPAPAIEVLRPVRVEGPEGSYAELAPAGEADAPGLHARISIDFTARAIGAQAIALHLTPAAFRAELAAARTFTQLSEVEAMQAAGLALGGSLDNAVVVDGDRVLNPGGMRMEREFVRHKLLDAVGDLALAGAALHGRLRAHRPSHRLNNALLHSLFADAANWRVRTAALA
jgi:UDP-3-O-[3-hydroxymyristoyl] N-acetylglucosamine deacetylase